MDQHRVVQGTVASAKGEPAPHLEVRLFEQSFRSEKPLGAGRTDENGRYHIGYTLESSECRTAILVRVLDGHKVAGQSPPHFDPPPLVEIDVTVGPEHVHGPSEYELILRDVCACTRDHAPADLTAEDVTFLTGSTDWSEEQLDYLVVAHRLAKLSEIEPPFFYALLRQQVLLGRNLSRLSFRPRIDLTTAVQPLYYDVVLLDHARIHRALAAAVTARQVGHIEHLERIFAILKKSEAAAREYYRTEQPKRLLRAISANVAAGKHREVLNVMMKHGRGDPSQFVAALHQVKLISADEAEASPLEHNPALVARLEAFTAAVQPAAKHSDKAHHRMAKLTREPRHAAALHATGFRSAAEIAALGQARFVRRVTADGSFSPAEARAVFRRANDLHVAAAMMAAHAHGLGNAAFVEAIAAPRMARLQRVARDNPNLESLFKLTDLCQCKDCNSVTSPAAYLAEVLQFLKNRLVVDTTNNDAEQPAKDVLWQRRADLGDLDLSCDNTNVPLPYIDIVNELLEQAVAPDPGFAFNGAITVSPIVPGQPPGKASAALIAALQGDGLDFTGAAYVQPHDLANNFYVRDEKAVCKLVGGGNNWQVFQLRQTFQTAEQLAAAPEYVNLDAYAALKASLIAFLLPFDLDHREARAYLDQFEVPRDRLMRALAQGGSPAGADTAADALGFSDAERGLVATGDPGHQNLYWNDTSANLKVVRRFLDRTGLEYAQLQEMLQTTFCNPGGDLYIQLKAPGCDLEKQEIANLDDAALDLLHRFLRVMRKLGWSAALLDSAISASRLGAGALTDDPFLVRVADLLRLGKRLRLPPEELIGWYGALSGTRYHELFLDATRNGSIDPLLVPATVAANLNKHLSDVADSLALALGIKRSEVDLLISLGNDLISFESLSKLYARVALGRALGRSVADLVALLRVTAIDPLATPDGGWKFVVAAAKVDKPGELQYLLQFNDQPTVILGDAAAGAILGQIQSALQAASKANQSPYDGTMTADENQTAVAEWVGRLPGVTPDQLSVLRRVLENQFAGNAPAALAQIFNPFFTAATVTNLQGLQAALAAAVGDVAIENARLALIKPILDGTARYLYLQARDAAVLDKVTAGLRVDGVATFLTEAHRVVSGHSLTLGEILGDDTMLTTTVAPLNLPDQYASLRLIKQMARLAAPLALAAGDLAWLLDNATQLGWLALDALPIRIGGTPISFTAWERLHDGLELFRQFPPVANPDDADQPFTFRGVFTLALTNGTHLADLLDLLAKVTGWDRAALGDLDTRFQLSAIDLKPYLLPETYARLGEAVTLVRKLGLTVAGALALIKKQLGPNDTAALRKALKSRYAEADWLGVLKQIQDPLREEKRDALVSYVLANNPDFESSDDLFDYFLVDVEMGACAPTSRIVSAHGTVQLFARRCLLGIEPEAVASDTVDDGWKQWTWMSAYRVWEANRKVFLWPENWIEPSLRDDKSELFVDLEHQLSQQGLTDQSVENATIGYLEALDDISFLEVMTSYYELRTLTYHVIARTKGGDPPTYYHRRFLKESSWTPWRRIDLDIKGNHVLAFTRNGRLHLAWVIFTAKNNPDQKAKIPSSNQSGNNVAEKTEQYWDIRLATSELGNDGKWTPSRTSQEPMPWPQQLGFYTTLPDQGDFRFVPMDMHLQGFSVICTLNTAFEVDQDVIPEGTYIGGFTLTGCKGYPEPLLSIVPTDYLFFPLFRNTYSGYERNFERGGDMGLQIMTDSLLRWVPIFGTTPDQFRVEHPQQIAYVDMFLSAIDFFAQVIVAAIFQQAITAIEFPLGTFMPYFFEDSFHNYVLVPALYTDGQQIEGPQQGPVRNTYADVQALIKRGLDLFHIYLPKFFDPNQDPNALLVQLEKDLQPLFDRVTQLQSARYGIEISNFYHPLVCPLRKTLYSDGIAKLMRRETQLQNSGFDFNAHYQPSVLVEKTPFGDPKPSYPVEDIDFKASGGYSSYNWELFFHLPLSIGVRLSADKQFEKAAEWFHYIFNPTDTSKEAPPGKYWQTRPFFEEQHYQDQRIDSILGNIAADPTGNLIPDLKRAIDDWRDNPFNPFLVARSRTVAFQQTVVMKYLDNLIAWGDSLFTQDTMESINQATQMYVLADKLLGPKPRIVPPLVPTPPETFNQLEAKIDLFSNALLHYEDLIPDLNLLPHGGDELGFAPLSLVSLYFCIPPNEKLLGYWDTVADRLFKIRHCQDIHGVERTLALFAPPIDPGALVAALAGGLSLSDVLAGLSAPLPFYRFTTMIQKATELSQQVIGLGTEMLQALEKRDAEGLQQLRAGQELALLDAQRATKLEQVADADEQIKVLQRQIDVTTERSNYYHSRELINEGEALALLLNAQALGIQGAAVTLDLATAVMHLIPSFSVGIAGFGGSPSASISFGGENIAGTMAGFAGVMREGAGILQGTAGVISTIASYVRRKQEWDFQATLADKELLQLGEQVTQANFKLAAAKADLAAHDKAIANAEEVDQFLRDKFTNQELYEYLVGQLSNVYFRSYQLALDFAHKAERCFQHELGVQQTFVQFDYWDNLKKGLLSGQRLLADVKRLEAAYIDGNRREYELTKMVSLAQLDPFALLQLKTTGAGSFSLPESLFDLDHPGHYFRRLKAVSVSVPCVAGPYTPVSGKLSLTANRYRKSADLSAGYPETPGNDTRFVYNVGTIQSIATSQGQNDSGLFELNFRDERYLPFEGQGALSTWKLELPRLLPQFDYGTIADVVLHLRYTARDAGSRFRGTVEGLLAAQLDALKLELQTQKGILVGFDVRRQFPNEWFQLQQSGSTSLTIAKELLPALIKNAKTQQVMATTWVAKVAGNPGNYDLDVDGNTVTLPSNTALGKLCRGDSNAVALDSPFSLGADNQLRELSLILTLAVT